MVGAGKVGSSDTVETEVFIFTTDAVTEAVTVTWSFVA